MLELFDGVGELEIGTLSCRDLVLYSRDLGLEFLDLVLLYQVESFCHSIELNVLVFYKLFQLPDFMISLS